MSRNILITGSNGQLGREFRALVANRERLEGADRYYFTDKETLDITDKAAVEHFVQENSIDTVINCAAYTAVDKAEEDVELAYLVNRDAVRNLAEVAKAYGVQLIHISTDYVFDGTSHTPLCETDAVNPQGVYAKSKLEGEEAIREIAPKGAMIIRTSWIYSSMGHNFVKTMLRVGSERNEIRVVCDQIGTPTYARDLARAILTIIESDNKYDEVKTYHYSNEGNCSWYDFAQAIFEIAQVDCKVKPISTHEYPTPAKRPSYSVLNKDTIKQEYNLEIPYWRDSLKSCISLLDLKEVKQYRVGIIGSGFIANGLAKLLLQHPDYILSGVLTRTDLSRRTDFIKPILKADIPVVTMNSEFHVTTGSYFVDKGLVTEAEGDQPGVEAILHEEALAMGFKPVAYVNIKGFLNENPSREDMEYWGAKSNLSLEMVTSFTDGTKVQIEQVLVANGLGACIAQEGLLKLKDDDMLHGGTILAEKAEEIGCPVSDYVLSSKLPAGVFLVVKHDEEQVDALRYYKLGEGPYYVLERTYHLHRDISLKKRLS